MPPIVAAVILATASVGSFLAPAIFVPIFTSAIGGLIIGGALSSLAAAGFRAIAGDPRSSSSGQTINDGRTISARSAAAAHRVLYGRSRLGGVLSFIHTTGTKNEFLHQVYAMGGHEFEEIGTMYFDDVSVPLDGNGDATGTYAGLVHVEKKLGTITQTNFSGLTTAAPTKWTTAHRGRGIAAVYVQLKFDADKFAQGFNVSFDCKGAKVWDPRTGQIAFSENSELCFLDYQSNTDYGYGDVVKELFTSSQLSHSGFTLFDAVAAVDGVLATPAFGVDSASSGATMTLDLGAGAARRFILCKIYALAAGSLAEFSIRWSDDGAAWTSVATGWVPQFAGWNKMRLATLGAHRYWQLQLTNTPGAGPEFGEVEFFESSADIDLAIAAANICDENVALKAGGTEKRYTTNGSFDTSEEPFDIMSKLLSAMAGEAVAPGDYWRHYAGAWRAASLTLTDDDLRGSLKINALLSRREIANTIKGVYVGPENKWQPADFPPVTNATYLAEDGEEIVRQIGLPFTASASTAQRLARIALETLRRQVTVEFPAKLSGFLAQSANTVQITRANRPDWTNKTFKVMDMQLVQEKDKNDQPIVGVDIVMQESDPDIYLWDPAVHEKSVALTAPLSTFPPRPFPRTIPEREIPPVTVGGRRSAIVGANPLTAADVGATATISVAASTVRYGFGNHSFNSGSITGLAFSTLYYVYAEDETYAGGAVTYSAVTVFEDVIGLGRHYLGQITTPADGGGGTGGSGGGGCPALEMFVGEQARVADLEPGVSWLMKLGDSGIEAAAVQSMDQQEQPCVRLVSQNGAALLVSYDTPFDTHEGRSLPAWAMQGEEVMTIVDGALQASAVESVTFVGMRKVGHVYAGGIRFAAGETPDKFMFSHNVFKD
ncbi:MAG: phage tail protein [Acidobacteria bacterium]|nr:phage tail protein [Acidobacteriota bacterium]